MWEITVSPGKLKWKTRRLYIYHPLKNINRITTLLLGLIITISSCSKQNEPAKSPEGPLFLSAFKQYLIPQNQHYCEQSVYSPIDQAELSFWVKFDSSAIYSTVQPRNQYDINKLYGFSDNDAPHHEFSARIGWRWSDGALRLFGYIYNNAVVSYEELGIVSIGAEHSCSIKITSNSYIFSVNEVNKTIPRLSTTGKAKGYKLFPYFGGDETAPHDIRIWIKEK